MEFFKVYGSCLSGHLGEVLCFNLHQCTGMLMVGSGQLAVVCRLVGRGKGIVDTVQGAVGKGLIGRWVGR